MLQEIGADTNLADGVGRTALMHAAGQGHVEVVHLLLDSDADTNLVAVNGSTVLTTASEQGRVEVVRLLLLEAHADSTRPTAVAGQL